MLFLPQVMKLRGSGILVSSDHWSISDSVCLKVLSQFSSHLHKTCNTCSVDVHGILIFLFKFLELSPFFKCFYKSVEKVCCPNSLHSCLSHLIADSSSKFDYHVFIHFILVTVINHCILLFSRTTYHRVHRNDTSYLYISYLRPLKIPLQRKPQTFLMLKNQTTQLFHRYSALYSLVH